MANDSKRIGCTGLGLACFTGNNKDIRGQCAFVDASQYSNCVTCSYADICRVQWACDALHCTKVFQSRVIKCIC